jgi:hypothetical protein
MNVSRKTNDASSTASVAPINHPTNKLANGKAFVDPFPNGNMSDKNAIDEIIDWCIANQAYVRSKIYFGNEEDETDDWMTANSVKKRRKKSCQ